MKIGKAIATFVGHEAIDIETGFEHLGAAIGAFFKKEAKDITPLIKAAWAEIEAILAKAAGAALSTAEAAAVQAIKDFILNLTQTIA